MTHLEQEQLLYKIINEAAKLKGLELIEVKMGWHRNEVSIQVLADKPDGGISLEACTSLNRTIVEMVDKEPVFSEDGYSLEVASPGLDRPLENYKDFLRNINAEVQVLLKEKVEGKIEYSGIVKSVSESELLLIINKGKQELKVPMAHILKGLLVI